MILKKKECVNIRVKNLRLESVRCDDQINNESRCFILLVAANQWQQLNRHFRRRQLECLKHSNTPRIFRRCPARRTKKERPKISAQSFGEEIKKNAQTDPIWIDESSSFGAPNMNCPIERSGCWFKGEKIKLVFDDATDKSRLAESKKLT